MIVRILERVLGRLRFNSSSTQFVRQHHAPKAAPANAHKHFALAESLVADGQLIKAVEQYREAVRLRPDFAEAYCNLSLLLHELGLKESEDIMRRAHELAPENRAIAANLRLQLCGQVPNWHFSMMNDASRNASYEAAICRALRPHDRVLDIGAGSGLLSMMAARMGATGITSCESVPAIAAMARRIVERNGYDRQINVVEKRSSDLRIPQDMPGRADLLVSEIFSGELLGEDVLPSFEHAKESLLKTGARIIPSQACIVGRLAGAEDLAHFLRVTTAAGFDLEPFNEFAPVTVFPSEWNIEMEMFSDPFTIFDFDFQGRSHFPAEKRLIRVPVTRNGLCYGVLQWIRLQLYDDIAYENSPESISGADRAGHWRHHLHTFEKPMFLRQGQTVSLNASHNRNNLVFFAE